MRDRITAADALLLAVPEYNHSFPAVLKNALDWASRPRPVSTLRHKPTALVGAGGGFGTVRAQLALRQVLASNEAYLMPKPELYVGQAPQRFDEAGRLTDDGVRQSVRELVAALTAWTRRLRVE
jgi:chromate reductase